MTRPAKPQRKRRTALPASATPLEGTDEILQVMYWLRGENIAQEVAPNELSKWIGFAPRKLDSLLRHLLGSGLVERVVVDSGRDEGMPRFRLTRAGVEEGRRRFAEEFSDFTKPRHFEHSDRKCDCEDVSRFSVSLKRSLFRQLDEMIHAKGYDNRSLAIADMIRDHLVEHWRGAGDFEAVGTIMLAYDPHDPQIRNLLTKLQEKHLQTIVSTLRVQSDPRSCMEVLVVRGKASAIKAVADRLIGAKGVKHGKLSITAPQENLGG